MSLRACMISRTVNVSRASPPDHEDDRRGSGAQDGHAADADAERIYQGYDDHAGADGQR